LVISVAAKQLNQPRKHHSFVLLDEFPTVFINDIQTLPNTGRSNKIASMFFCQDLSQLTDGYTKEKADVLFASCLNHFYGQVSSSHTADILSKQFGKKDQYFESNNTRHFLNPFKRNVGQSRSVQERTFLEIQFLWSYRLVNSLEELPKVLKPIFMRNFYLLKEKIIVSDRQPI
jgi:type IV secretory pathway TraG/TraD family ATPase VirD4